MLRKVDCKKNKKLMLDAIVLCAGSSTRFNAEEKNTHETKILAKIDGKPALEYLLETLVESPFVRNCVFVLPENKAVQTKIKELVKGYRERCSDRHWLFAQGGARRQDSLKNGLQALCKSTNGSTNGSWCMVCDAARPLVSHVLLERIATSVARIRERQANKSAEIKKPKIKKNGKILGVIPLLPIADSIKRIDKKGLIVESIEREDLRQAQTPQAFPAEKMLEWLLKAEQKMPRKNFTDEAQLAIENLAEVTHIQGEARAHKITTLQDIPILEGLLTAKKNRMVKEKKYTEFRSCSAFDQHKVCKGKVLRLCATDIPCNFALEGHSDADVALHALTDAILALAGSGDIGEHFPPNEKKWRNANSAIFLKHAIEILSKAGGKLVNADITILAEKPNLKSYKQVMRDKLAELTELERSRIGLKATTLEGLGALGQAKGIAAYASATAKFF